jgi:tetratricopeptide (TPR) repeat protein
MRPLFEEALAIQESQPGHAAENLGLFLKGLGKYADAERALRRAVEVNRDSMVALAQLLQTEGKRDEAIEFFRPASEGVDAHASAQGFEGLAKLSPANAPAYFAKAVSAEETASGKDSLRVAALLDNEALAVRARGDLKGAEGMLRRALAIQENKLGRGHYRTAATLSNLATVLQSLGKIDEAESLEQEARSVFEQRMPQSQELAAVYANLADLRNRKGDYDGAIVLLRLAIAGDEASAGPSTLELAADLANLGRILRRRKSAEAEPLLRRALSIYETRLGPKSAEAEDVRRTLKAAAR